MVNNISFHVRVGDIEVRADNTSDASEFVPEVVKWNKPEECKEGDYPSCYTLCYWVQDLGRGWYLRFVYSRPFEEFRLSIPDEIWAAMFMLNQLLNKK